MATNLQWVNYPEADTKIGKTSVARANFVDADLTSTAVMGRKIYLAVKFEKKDSSLPATLTIKPDAKNAQYTKKERKRHPGICAPGLTAATKIGSDGVGMFTAHVTDAGGDRFEFTAKSSKAPRSPAPTRSKRAASSSTRSFA